MERGRTEKVKRAEADKVSGVIEKKEIVKCFTDFLSVKYFTVFAFDFFFD